MIKAQKVKFVEKLKKEITGYKVVGVMPISAVPDRLVQRARNNLRADTRVVIARKNLLMRALDGNPSLKELKQYLGSNSALILSNKDPIELHKLISANRIKLGAKPNQVAPEDISIEAGETTIPPGQAVTDLKAGGIDVQIQKGKVVISKSKVLVKKGDKISTGVSKALKLLDIQPFEASTRLSVIHDGKLLYTERALSINEDVVRKEIARSFATANLLSTEAGIVTQYNVNGLVRRAYISALGLGLQAKLYTPGIVDKLIAEAVAEALSLKKTANIPDDAQPAAASTEAAAPEAPKDDTNA